MKNRSVPIAAIALISLLTVTSGVSANGIARFNDPAVQVPPPWMFYAIEYGLYAYWAGPPYIQLETPAGTIVDCWMRVTAPMYNYPPGHLSAGEFMFYDLNQVEVLRFSFTNGVVDFGGVRSGPQTGGTVQFTWSPSGVKLPAGLTEPLQGAWFNFEFHNYVYGPRGPQWTASFTSGAVGQKGDLNCDGAVTFDDIDPFVLALSDPASYNAANPWCAVENADINGDGQVVFADIDPFVALLSGGA